MSLFAIVPIAVLATYGIAVVAALAPLPPAWPG